MITYNYIYFAVLGLFIVLMLVDFISYHFGGKQCSLLKFDETKGRIVVYVFILYVFTLILLVESARAEAGMFSWMLGVIFYNFFDMVIMFSVANNYRRFIKISTFVMMIISMILLKIAGVSPLVL